MKAHIGLLFGYGTLDECLHGEEAVIYGDKAYANEGRRQAAVAQGIDWRVNRKARRGKRQLCGPVFNRKSNRTRSRVEHPLAWSSTCGAIGSLFALFALANFYLARREFED